MKTKRRLVSNWHMAVVLPALVLSLACSNSGLKEVHRSEQEEGVEQSRQRPGPVPEEDLIGKLTCSSFEWVPYEGLSEHAAIKVPVELDGELYWFQLDTGLDVTVLYGTQEAERRGWQKVEPPFIQANSARISGTDLPERRMIIKEDLEPGGEIMGSLGLNFLLGNIVVIDFPNQRFCVVRQSDMPEEILHRTAFVPGLLRNNKFFVLVKANGSDLQGIFYDTGSSAFPIVVDLKLWKELTGQAGAEGATHTIQIPSWGEEVPMIGAPLLGTLEIGSVSLEHPLIYYWGNQPEFFENWPFPAAGLIGNSLFVQEVVVLDLGSQPRFGIFR